MSPDPAAEPGLPAADLLAERAAQAGVLTAALICFATALLGSCGLLARWPLAILTVALLAPAARAFRRMPALPGRIPVPWPLWLGLPLLLAEALAALPLPPRDWDAMTYHLFLPARWLEEGKFVHVPTVFGDDIPAYAPQNGALLYAWWMGLVGGDSLLQLVPLAALVLLAAALWLLARRLGAGPLAAAMVVALLPWLAPLRDATFAASVDLFQATFWIAAAAFLLGDGRRGDLLFGGLALGLAIGTKTVGIPLAAGLVAVAAPRLWRAPRRDLALFAAAVAATGSFWWLRNLWLYGNPLFPLDTSLGSWRLFPGIFSPAAVRDNFYHRNTFGEWLASLHGQWGTFVCLWALAGTVALLWAPRRRPGIELGLLAFGWTLFFWRVVPFNNQARFLLPVLALAVVGWAGLLERLPRRPLRGVALAATVAILAGTGRPDRFVGQCLEWLTGPLPPRVAALAETDFALWRDGYLPFNHPDLGPKRIAYAGFNVPYALVGPGMRNHVVYCNVSGRPADGLWDFWRPDPVLQTPLSRIYRRQEGAAAWLACLAEEGIDTVAVFRMLPPLPELRWPDDDDGFPVERRWLREHPELFEPLLRQPNAEIWTVRPAAPPSPEPRR